MDNLALHHYRQVDGIRNKKGAEILQIRKFCQEIESRSHWWVISGPDNLEGVTEIERRARQSAKIISES